MRFHLSIVWSAMPPLTRHDVLSKPNPLLDTSRLKSGNNSQNYNYVEMADTRLNISIWDDFTLDNIKAAYGNLLQETSNVAPELQEWDDERWEAMISADQRRLVQERGMDNIVQKWNIEIVSNIYINRYLLEYLELVANLDL